MNTDDNCILNNDVIELIALCIDDVDTLLYWGLTCKRFADVCNSNSVWKEQYRKNGLTYINLGRKSIVSRVCRFNQVKTGIIHELTTRIMEKSVISFDYCKDSRVTEDTREQGILEQDTREQGILGQDTREQDMPKQEVSGQDVSRQAMNILERLFPCCSGSTCVEKMFIHRRNHPRIPPIIRERCYSAGIMSARRMNTDDWNVISFPEQEMNVTNDEMYNFIYSMVLSGDVRSDIVGRPVLDRDLMSLAFKVPYIPVD